MKRKHVAAALVSVLAVPAAAAAFFTFTAYDPPEFERLTPFGKAGPSPAVSRLSVMTWNIGYAGLDRDTDFFMDGGKMAGPRSREAVAESLRAINDEVARETPDVVFLQEVDRASARTWDIDQVAAIAARLPDRQGWYATNFRSPFVPAPASSPIGRVESGLVTLLSHPAREATRAQLPGSYSWPVRLFHLKRCALIARLPSPVAGRDWVLVNLHLSAFDDGSHRKAQLAYLRDKMLEWHAQGHFVVLGGDWNSTFPGVDRERFAPYTTTKENLGWIKAVAADWTPPGWQWAYDVATPTVRTNDRPYRAGESYRTIIDGFLVSPNVQVESVIGVDLGFAHSDHQPVRARLCIRKDGGQRNEDTD